MRATPLADQELSELLADEPSLLVLADALAEAHETLRKPTPPGKALSRRLAVLVAATIVVFSLAGAAIASLTHLFAGTPVPPTELSQTDWATLTAASQPSRAQVAPAANLRDAGVASIVHIADSDGRSFYVISRLDGSKCYASGTQGGLREALDLTRLSILGMVSCPTGALAFPSRTNPVLDMSVSHGGFSTEGGVASQFVWRLAGFASDAVASIAILGADGAVHVKVPVVDNVYVATDLQPFAPRAIVAYDTSGSEVWRKCLAATGCA
jgi:hypothetical protein